MTIRKERRRKEKRLNRSLLTAKGLTVATTVVAGSTLAPNLGLAAETTTSEDTKNQTEVAKDQTSTENQATVSTVESTSSMEETTSTEETTASTVPIEEQASTSASEDSLPQESAAENTAIVEMPTVAAPTLASSPSIFSTRADTSGFIAKASGYAKEVAAANNLYASVMIAQAILESGWGTSALTTQANNMFGIKGSYNGQYVEMATLEDNGSGNYYQILAKFRKYPSLRESFEDNAYVLRNTSFAAGSYYYSGTWVSNTSSYREATAWLQGRYATDTSYASKLNHLIATYNLTQYDSVNSGTGSNGDTNLINTSAKEDAVQKQMKTTAAINIRSDASTTSTITGSLASNTTITVVATKAGTSVNGNTTWYKISGKGWVSGAYLTESTGANSSSNTNNTTNTNNTINQKMKTTATVNIRSTASTSGSVVGSLNQGSSVTVTAVKNGTSVNGNAKWYYVSGKGWVSGAYLTSTGTNSSSNTNNTTNNNNTINQKMKTTATLNVRSTASTSGSVVGSLSQGSSVTVTAVKNGTSVNGNTKWYYVSGKGWVSGAYLTSTGTNSSSNTTSTTNTNNTINQKMKTTASLNIRSTASTSGSVVGSLSQGSSVTVTAVKNGTSVNGNTKWYYVSGKGWVSGAYLTTDTSTSSSSSSASSSSSSQKYHTVKSGDSLWALAQKYGSSIDQIISWNRLTNNLIYVGQKLVVNK